MVAQFRFFVVLLLLPLIVACGAPTAREGKVRAMVTVIPHVWLVEQIGGEHVEVAAMVRPGESAELYQPTDAEVSRVMSSDVYFRVGMPLEDSPGFRAIRASKLRIVDLREGIALRPIERHSHHEEAGHDEPGHDHAHEDEEGRKDPHIWLSPRLLKVQARTVADTLCEIDPPHADDYRANLAAVLKRLDELDREIGKLIEPYRGRAFFVFHPAWGYFAEDYGLRQMAIETGGKEPSDRELSDLQQEARAEKIRVIFVQPQSAGRAAKAIAEAIGGRTETAEDLAKDLPNGLLQMARRLAESYQ
jgi:zinc transport system substrate-binding protein